MKKLEDAPKELQAMFHTLFKEHLSDHEYPLAYKEAYAHFFLKGFDVGMATGGLKAMKPKRIIAEVHQLHDDFFVISNDRKMFHWQGNEMGWYALPELPQD